MKRKLIEQGKTTLMISLPSKWVKKYGLIKGNEVELNEFKGDLIVSTENELSSSAVSIDVSGLNQVISRYIGAMYKAGYDEIDVKFSEASELQKIQEAIDKGFIGFEIVEQRKNSVLCKKISSIDHSEFDVTFRRMFLFLLSISEDLMKSIEEKDIEGLKSIKIRDNQINKLSDFCRRSINKRGHPSFSNTAPLYYIIETLEKVGDFYRDLSVELCGGSDQRSMVTGSESSGENELEKKTISTGSDDFMELDETIFGCLKKANDLLRTFYELFYKTEIKKVDEFLALKKSCLEEMRQISKTLDKSQIMTFSYVYSLLNSIFDMNGALLASKSQDFSA